MKECNKELWMTDSELIERAKKVVWIFDDDVQLDESALKQKRKGTRINSVKLKLIGG